MIFASILRKQQDALSDISLTGQGPDDVISKHELLEIKIILMTELMATGRDCSFMIRN